MKKKNVKSTDISPYVEVPLLFSKWDSKSQLLATRGQKNIKRSGHTQPPHFSSLLSFYGSCVSKQLPTYTPSRHSNLSIHFEQSFWPPDKWKSYIQSSLAVFSSLSALHQLLGKISGSLTTGCSICSPVYLCHFGRLLDEKHMIGLSGIQLETLSLGCLAEKLRLYSQHRPFN